MPETKLRIQRDLALPMRDSVTLYANLVRPDDDQTYPAIVIRLPYSKELFTFDENNPVYMRPDYYAGKGYNVYVVECRGSGKSEGVSAPDGSNELLDGYDTVEWVAAQPLCDGNIGMYGLSYFGMTQMAAASTRPPHLRAICPCQCTTQVPVYIERGGMFVPGHLRWLYGQAQGELALMKLSEDERKRISDEIERYRPQLTKQCMHVPLVDAPAIHIPGFPYLENFIKAIDNMDNEAYWKKSGIPYRFDRFEVPMLHVTGWYDSVRPATVENYQLARQQVLDARVRECQKLVIGPWVHGLPNQSNVGEIDFGPKASPEDAGLADLMLAWFDHFLKGLDNGLTEKPEARYFLMGANEWRQSESWPPVESTPTAFYLDSLGSANSLMGNGTMTTALPSASSSDSYIHDPMNPVPAKPWPEDSAFDPMTEDRLPPLMDYSPIERRQDVLVYSTPAVEESMDLAGEIHAVLYAAATGEDADFFCRLTDVYPDGRSMILTEGGVRARYRSSMFREDFIQPGEIYKYDISMGETALRLLPGHRLRLEIMSSCYPATDINMGTAEKVGHQSRALKTTHTILHENAHPSYLSLPLLQDKK